MKKLRLGIIGIGNIGSRHAYTIMDGQCPDLEIVAIADKNPKRLQWAKEQNYAPHITFFDDPEVMLDSGLLDACIVSTPHYDHPKYAIACLERGIHVMVEKPAGVYTKQVREMNDAADRHPDTVFGLMFNQRTSALYRKLKELVDSGRFGEIRRTHWLITDWYRPQAYYDSKSWRATWSGEGGGVLINQCPHQLDLWQWICGMPKKVYAKMHFGKWHDIEVEDDVTAYVEYENGATGVFVTSTGDGGGSNRLEIQMDKAKFVVENGKLTVTEFDKSVDTFNTTCTDPFGALGGTTFEAETDGYNPQHVGVLNAWADAILRGGKLVARGQEGIHSLTLSNAMHLSAFLGKEIELPLDEELYYEELMKRVRTSKPKKHVTSVFADTSGNNAAVAAHYQMK